MKRILIDCDGILSDFCTACFDLIEQHTGDRHEHHEVTGYDVFDSLGKGHIKHLLKEAAASPGWCSGMLTLPGAKEGLAKLHELGEVVIVTSPMSVPNWACERTQWLKHHFGIDKDRVVHTSGKHYVKGDVFIDDMAENCFKWNAEHPGALTLLWDAPYNQDANISTTAVYDEPEAMMFRVKTWGEACALIEQHFAGHPHLERWPSDL